MQAVIDLNARVRGGRARGSEASSFGSTRRSGMETAMETDGGARGSEASSFGSTRRSGMETAMETDGGAAEPETTEPTVRAVETGRDAEVEGEEAKAREEDAREEDARTVTVETMVNPASVVTPDEAKRPPAGAAVHMTERQLYAFRQQIAAYAHICQQLLQITTVNATQQTDRQRAVRKDVPGTEEMRTMPAPMPAGVGWSGNAGVAGPRADAGGQRGGRGEDKSQRGPRWSGTPKHYEILESLFLAGEQPPVRERLREVTEMLSQYGHIQESNVYNWFQNRRSREKKKIAEEQAHASAAANAAMQM